MKFFDTLRKHDSMAKTKIKPNPENTLEWIDPSRWRRGKLNPILSQCRGKKVLVIGDVGVDRYTLGTVERISPEAPVPIVAVEEEKLKLGLAANVADNIRALGGVPL